MPLLGPDRPLLSPAVWAALPELLEDLLRRERILLCVLEDSDTGCLRFLGGSGFLDRQFLEAALGDPRESVLNRALAAERKSGLAFLNVRQVGDANRRTDLRLLNFFGVPFKLDPNLEIGIATEAWNFFHKGFQFAEIWAETADPVQAGLLKQIGMRLHREHTSRTGDPVSLFHVSREDALRTPAAWPASAMLSSRPRFGFTRRQQKLLELALLDHSDREMAERLELSEDALKKRWRSIYLKVSELEPRLLQPDDSGAVQRRALLHRLRHNLEELRPF
jgi:hypothetical protein